NVDMIIQNEPVSAGARADISFTIPRSKVDAARAALAPLESELGISAFHDELMGKVSVVGAGMKSHPGVAAKVFTVLGDEGVNIEMIATSPIKISCVIAGERVPGAARALHTAFELAGPDTMRPERPFGEFA
ncbi:MAG TPA: ACT domain-containing protein, partial [Solirubrobacteraceae bacterium]